MTNADVARVFDQLADLMEIRGDDGFRVSAYRRIGRAIDDLAEDIHGLAEQNALQRIPGVGKSSAEKIKVLLRTGRLDLRDELTREVPESLLELREIPTLGPKKIALLWKTCGVTSLADLVSAIDLGKLNDLKGFGAKSIEQIKRGIAFHNQSAGRIRLSTAIEIGEKLRDEVARVSGVRRVEIAGSLRRGRETVGDLDLLCIASDGGGVIERFTHLPGVTQVLVAGDTKGSIHYEYRPGRTVQVDLRVVPEASFGAAWQYFTGSKEHNVRLRERAVKRGWTLNEYGLVDAKTEKVIAGTTEEEIYATLGLPWIPPELREDRGEFELTGPPELLTLRDIRGDLHVHTTASDGSHSIEQMVAAAAAHRYEYICITDHSPSSAIANGLKPDRLLKHMAAVRALAAKTLGLTVWIGAEVDIRSDGSLDYEDEILAQLDWVVASVHQGQGTDRDANTRRTLAAIRNPYVNLIAHPTGRLINRREAMPLDIDAVAREAARTGTALEINASGMRLDLRDQHARLARDLGAMICIDTDAHAIEQLEQMPLGITTARRAGLRKSDVLNTRSAAEIREFVNAKRQNHRPT